MAHWTFNQFTCLGMQLRDRKSRELGSWEPTAFPMLLFLCIEEDTCFTGRRVENSMKGFYFCVIIAACQPSSPKGYGVEKHIKIPGESPGMSIIYSVECLKKMTLLVFSVLLVRLISPVFLIQK